MGLSPLLAKTFSNKILSRSVALPSLTNVEDLDLACQLSCLRTLSYISSAGIAGFSLRSNNASLLMLPNNSYTSALVNPFSAYKFRILSSKNPDGLLT